jgi:two-component system sensor histidine kinase CreC
MHTLAHELKSPIAAIQGAAELLQEEMPADQRQHFLANILEQNARQQQLIDKLLALVKVEKQQRLVSAQPIQASELLAQLQADFFLRLAARNLALQVQADDMLVSGDPLLLRQALGNLLDNAIAFAPPGSTIELTARQIDKTAVITLCDRGPGIPAFAGERIFERFYSLPRPGGDKSTGIGLPFVREVASLHGGAISVTNREGGGTCAQLNLPLAWAPVP